MALIAFGVLVCAYGELNLVVKGLVLQLSALGFEVIARYCKIAKFPAVISLRAIKEDGGKWMRHSA